MSLSSSVRTHVLSLLDRARIPGCVAVVVDRHGIREHHAFGLADVARRRPVAVDDVFHLFSGTKLFTATAVLQLVERGRLELDAPVGRYLPELPPAAAEVTLAQLLSHRSGLAETLRGLLAVTFPDQPPPTSAQALANYQLRRARPPGTRVEYRNVNYALLGELISRVTGVDYADHVTASVLAPLGVRAGFTWTDTLRARAVPGYLGRLDPMRLVLRWLFPKLPGRLYRARVGRWLELGEYTLTTAAAGGLIGAMPDFAAFVAAQLQGGGAILGAEATARMQSLVAEGAAGIASRRGVGLGWKHGVSPAGPFLNHEGGGAGFTSELRIYPERGLGFALGMNAMRMPTTMRAAHDVCEALLAAQA